MEPRKRGSGAGRSVGNGRGEALLIELDPVVERVEWYVDGAGQVLARAVGGPAVDEPEDEAAEDGGVGAVAGLAHGDCAGMSEAEVQGFVGEDEIVVTRFAGGDEGTGRASARGLGQRFVSGDDARDELVVSTRTHSHGDRVILDDGLDAGGSVPRRPLAAPQPFALGPAHPFSVSICVRARAHDPRIFRPSSQTLG